MSTFYYYDNDGQKQGPVTSKQLKGLAQEGQITPETIIESEEGMTSPARQMKSLTFDTAASQETTPPAQNPFTASVPDDNPFSAPAPAVANSAPATNNPFSAPAPATSGFPQKDALKSFFGTVKSAFQKTAPSGTSMLHLVALAVGDLTETNAMIHLPPPLSLLD